MERGESPVSPKVWVGTVFEGEFDAVFVVPVGFAEEDGVEACLVEFAAGENDLEDGVVVGFGDVVGGFFVVGVGSAVEEELGEAGVLREAGGAVDDGLEGGTRIGVVDHLVPAGVGAGSGVEQSTGGVNEGWRAGRVEPEVAREAEVSQSVPVVRAPGAGRVVGILDEEFFDGGFVGEDGGGVDVRGGDVRVAVEDELGVFEGARGVRVVARNARGFDEGGDGIGEVGDSADKAVGFEVGGEFGPTLEAVLAGEDELSVGEREVCAGDVGNGESVKGGVMAMDTTDGFRVGGAMGLQEFFGLFFVLFEVWAAG